MTSSFRAALILALAILAAACSNNEQQQAQQPAARSAAPAVVAAPAKGPDVTVMASVHALRNNDVAALLANALPPAELTKLKADWNKEMNKEPITDEERQRFNEEMGKLTAPGAEQRLYAEIEPELKQFEQQSAQQMPMMIAMGQGLIQSAIQQNKDIDEPQRQQAMALVNALAQWAQTAQFTSPALAKQAIDVVCKTARALDVKTLDQVRALDYDQAMKKAGIALAGFKQLLAVYGLSFDKALDSVKVDTLATSGDTAKIKVSYVAFDKPFTTENEMVRVDGGWYSKQAVEQWKKAQQETASAATDAAKEPATGK